MQSVFDKIVSQIIPLSILSDFSLLLPPAEANYINDMISILIKMPRYFYFYNHVTTASYLSSAAC